MFLPTWDGATREYSPFCTGMGHLLCLLFSQNASSHPAQYKQVPVDLGTGQGLRQARQVCWAGYLPLHPIALAGGDKH